MANDGLVGKVSHYYSQIGVGIVKMEGTLKVGDQIKVKGYSTEFDQTIDSIQIDHKEVESADKGDIIGMKVNDKVREGDEVFKVE